MSDLMEIKIVHLHGPLFVGGKNHKDKIDLSRHNTGDIRMQYDRVNKELLVTYNDETAIVPVTNINSMVPGEAAKAMAVVQPIAQKITAQVSTPQGHVFAGQGHGKNGKDR